ncbi:hypothetical protein JXJ21_15935 [candidate division KSB1 bacterium]|nr:hypothetical protein [candidate division KSB1 bacterium]
MERKQKIENEIQRTLEQFEHADRLRPNPFFYTRVKARIEAQTQGAVQGYVHRVLKPAFLTLLVAVNVITAVFLLNNSATETNTRQSLINSFAKEYRLENSESNLYILNGE